MFSLKLSGNVALKIASSDLADVKAFKRVKPFTATFQLDDKTKQAAKFIEHLWVDGTEFGLFKFGRNYLLQMKQAIRKEQQRIETIEQACELIRTDAWTFDCHYHFDKGRYDRMYSAIADYLDSDLRVCLDIRCYSTCTYIQVQERSGYDEKEHCWPEEGIQYETRIESKRGQKLLLDLQYELYEAGHSHNCKGWKDKFSANRKNGKLFVY
jgi:hypothetical protein